MDIFHLEYWDGDTLVSEVHINQITREYHRKGENICGWEAARRMALKNNQNRVEVWCFNPWGKGLYLRKYLYTDLIDGRFHFVETGENGF